MDSFFFRCFISRPLKMSRNVSTKHPGSNPVPKAASRNLAVGKKVVQPLPSKPQPNSILRLEEKVASARNELAAASAGGPRAENLALTLAQRRIVDSPRTNRHFRKVVARKVDFRPDEQIFSHLASLSVLEDDDDDVAGGRKKKPFERPLLDHDPGGSSRLFFLKQLTLF